MESMIEQLNFLAFGWWLWMLTMAWQVAIVAGVVWCLTRLWGRSSGAWKHALWMVVLLKLILPPSLAAPWSVATLVADEPSGVELGVGQNPVLESGVREGAAAMFGTEALASDASIVIVSPMAWLMLAWGVIALGLFTVIVFKYGRYAARVRSSLVTPSGALQGLFEKQLGVMEMHNAVLLRQSEHLSSPAVFGVSQAIVIVPSDFEARFSGESQAAILRHELAHVKRRDLVTGWFSTVLTCLYWFHPLVWVAHYQARQARELACDDAALQSTPDHGEAYAETMLVVSEKSGLVPLIAGFHGILEPGGNLKSRVCAAMDSSRARRLSLKGLLVLFVCTLTLLPMSAWQPSMAATPEEVEESAQTLTPTPKPVKKTPYPQVVSISPKIGAKDVDPALKEIRVVFDRDMAGGFSWTGGKPLFPELSGKPMWIDKRTCVLPVKLKVNQYCRVGLNSTSFGNFKSVKGKSTPPQAIYFTTKGYKADAARPVQVPKLLKHEYSSTDIAGEYLFTITFDQPMGGGMSVVTLDGPFPEIKGKLSWSTDKKTLSFRASMKEGVEYKMGFNSLWHINFQSELGIPLKAEEWAFKL